MTRLFTCPDCFGDGKETCHNPDHGFITAIGGELGRLGCPVCGHNAKHKVRSGGPCCTCDGVGNVTLLAAREFCEVCDYDFDDIMSQCDPDFYEKIPAEIGGAT